MSASNTLITLSATSDLLRAKLRHVEAKLQVGDTCNYIIFQPIANQQYLILRQQLDFIKCVFIL